MPTLSDRVSCCLSQSKPFSPAVTEALRLADLYEDVRPEVFTLPASDTFDAYRSFGSGFGLVGEMGPIDHSLQATGYTTNGLPRPW